MQTIAVAESTKAVAEETMAAVSVERNDLMRTQIAIETSNKGSNDPKLVIKDSVTDQRSQDRKALEAIGALGGVSLLGAGAYAMKKRRDYKKLLRINNNRYSGS